MSKLNYCMLKSELPHEAYVIYVAEPDRTEVHPSIVDHKNFAEVKMILEFHGFEFTNSISFRIPKKNKLKVRELHADLLDNGYVRYKPLENSIKRHMANFLSLTSGPNVTTTHHSSAATQSMTPIPVFTSPKGVRMLPAKIGGVRTKKTKADIVGVNEAITLNVYLFLRAMPTEDNSIEFEFEFDFFSKANNDFRRFIKIIECTFVRKDQGTGNIIYLESEKTLGDILKELDLLFSIRLMNPNDALNGVKSDPITYNAIELKDFLNLDGRISLHVDIHESYGEIVALSRKIGEERVRHARDLRVPVSLIKRASKNVLDRMEQRMAYYSDHEDYELAASYKKSHAYIQNKVQALEAFDKKGVDKLNNEDYESCFSMKDLDL